MEGSGLSWGAIVVAAAVLAAVQGAVLVLWRRPFKRPKAPAQRPQGSQDSLITCALSQEIDDLKEQMSALKAEVQSLKASKPVVSPYNQALHMAKQGYGVGEVASQCGISRGEAELIIALYRKSKINGVE